MIYYYVYPSAMQNAGGGEILLLKSYEYLKHRGAEVQLFDMWNDRFESGDLLHVFGSVKEALGLMQAAASKGVIIVQSPIIWYNWQAAFCVAYGFEERVKCVVRQAAKSFFPWLPSARKKMLALASIVTAGSEMEAGQIERYFRVPKSRIRVIQYGVDEAFGHGDPTLFRDRFGFNNYILSVGRIEPRKNQLNLILATKNMDTDVAIVGDPVSHHRDYYDACKRAAGPQIHFVGGFDNDSEMLKSAFAGCQTLAMPSWFETPGLAALEAALAGANLVITQGGSTREYFSDFAMYINPADINEIRSKLVDSLSRPKTEFLANHVRSNFPWSKTAQETLASYVEAGYTKQLLPAGV